MQLVIRYFRFFDQNHMIKIDTLKIYLTKIVDEFYFLLTDRRQAVSLERGLKEREREKESGEHGISVQ